MGKIFLKTVTMKMAVERSIKDQAGAGAIGREGWQTVPINVETAVVKRVDRLMKHVTLVNIVAVRQAGSNWQNSKQYCQKKDGPPTNPEEDAGLWRRSLNGLTRLEQEREQTRFRAEEKQYFVLAAPRSSLFDFEREPDVNPVIMQPGQQAQ